MQEPGRLLQLVCDLSRLTVRGGLSQGKSCRGSPEHVEPPKDANGTRYDSTIDAHDSILVTYKDQQGWHSSVILPHP